MPKQARISLGSWESHETRRRLKMDNPGAIIAFVPRPLPGYPRWVVVGETEPETEIPSTTETIKSIGATATNTTSE